MKKIIEFFQGKKSYLLGLAAIAYGIGGYFSGNLDPETAQQAIWAGLTAMAIRAGITNENPKTGKRKKHRKAIAEAELKATRKRKKTIEKWLKEYYEGKREDYPTTKQKLKKLSWKKLTKTLTKRKF